MVNRLTLETGRTPRRSTAEIPILGPDSLDQILQRSVSTRDSCMVALLYLTGRRIMEILPVRVGDVITSNPLRVVVRTFNEKSYRQKRTGRYLVEKPGTYRKKEKDGSVAEYYVRYYEAIEPEFSTQGPSGVLLGHYVTEYLEELKEKGGDYLFPPGRRSSRPYINQPRAYQIIRSLDDGLWLHAMRHIDFTRMAEVYQDDPVAMHRLTYHRRFESTLGYIKNREKGDKLAKM